MSKYKTKTIRLISEEAYQEAEGLAANGWKIIAVGFDSITLEKEN